MTDRTELLEAALNCFPEGVALLGEEGNVVFWSQAAEAITGYSGYDLLGRPIPEPLKTLLDRQAPPGDAERESDSDSRRGFPVQARHKLGHEGAGRDRARPRA